MAMLYGFIKYITTGAIYTTNSVEISVHVLWIFPLNTIIVIGCYWWGFHSPCSASDPSIRGVHRWPLDGAHSAVGAGTNGSCSDD